MKRFDEALELLDESFRSLSATQGETNPRTLLAKSRYDQLQTARQKGPW